jgi:hypothetical protein
MNESYLNGRLDKLHTLLINPWIRPSVKNAFIKKKLSDYYFSKLIPDFFYHAPLANNYYPTIIATRVTIPAVFFILFSFYIYRRNLHSKRDAPKKYKFNYYSKDYLEYEKELLLFEKSRKNKIIL